MKLASGEQFSPLVRKAWRVMRITTLLILVISLHLSARTTAQKITLFSNNISIEQFFNQLEKQTGYSFLLENGIVSKDKKISINVKDALLETVLDQILKPINLSYKIENKTVYILKAHQPFVSGDASISNPPIEIHGRVTDSLGNPLVGASIAVKGSKRGASSDSKGDFVLYVENESAVLIVSFTGYDTKSITVNGTNALTVSLKHSNSLLDQVQIIAYGTTTQRLTTGDVSMITSEQISRQPITNAVFSMEGLVPGIAITQTSGVPNSGFMVQIRGLNSIANGSNPLYVVDGIPYVIAPNTPLSLGVSSTTNADITNPLNYINPLDIESVSVLKDADATSIYGSRGANGVVLITTKKGKVGKTKVDVNFFAGGAQVAREVKLLNTPQYVEMRREAFSNDSLTPTISTAPDLLLWDTTKYTDWQKKFIGGTANILNTQVSISGGDKNTQFLVSGNYRKDGTVFPGDFSDTRASVNLNINNISDNGKFRSNIGIIYLSDNNHLPEVDPTLYAQTFAPNTPDLIDSKGNLLWPPFVPVNPYAILRDEYNSKASNLLGQANFIYTILPHLNLSVDMGYNTIGVNEIETNPISSNNPAFGISTGNSQFATSTVQSWNIEPQIRWGKTLGNGKLDILFGATFQQSERQGNTISAYGYTNDALLEDPYSAGSISSSNSYSTLYRYNAFFGRINYDLESKYIINLTGRRDGSSRFGPGNRFSNFGSIGAAWIFTNENFFKEKLSFLSFGKLRGSFGISGNDAIPDYGYLELWSGTGLSFQGAPTLYPTNLSNSNYRWESDKKLEFGLNLGFVKDRILLAGSWYQNRTGNQLVGYSLPPSVGYSSVQANLPAVVQNTGVEITLNTVNIKNSDFIWTTYFNISVPRNKLVSYPDIQNSSYATRYEVGKSLYTPLSLHSIGVNPKTGIYQYQDVDGSGTGTDIPGDLQATKQLGQDYYGGLENTLSFKGFQLDFLFQFVDQTGHSYVINSGNTLPGAQGNQSIDVLNRWKEAGDDAEYQKFSTGGGLIGRAARRAFFIGRAAGDNRIVDASFIRLRNISLSYSLPSKWMQSINVTQATVYIQAQNLLTITSYQGADPEYQSVQQLTPLRSIVGGIKLTL